MTHMAHHLVGALADGELRGLRRWLVNRHVQRCPVCAADFRAQRQVRQVLAASRVDVRMSDSPEFFWSKVKRDIARARTRAASQRLRWHGRCPRSGIGCGSAS